MRHFGQSGYDFYRFVRGIDDRPVRSSRVRKSVGCERTFERDVRDPVRLRGIIGELAAELAFRLGRADFAGSLQASGGHGDSEGRRQAAGACRGIARAEGRRTALAF